MDWSTLAFISISIGAICGALHVIMKRIEYCEDMILKLSEMQYKNLQHTFDIAKNQRDLLALITGKVNANEELK